MVSRDQEIIQDDHPVASQEIKNRITKRLKSILGYMKIGNRNMNRGFLQKWSRLAANEVQSFTDRAWI